MVNSEADAEIKPKLSVYQRRILAQVEFHGGTMGIVELATVLGAERTEGCIWRDESNASTRTVKTKRIQERYIELVTEMLPLLEQKGLINYCDQQGEISILPPQR